VRFSPWPLIAAIGLGVFALMSWIIASKAAIPFDQPLLDSAKGLDQYMGFWRLLSDAANYPLIAIGIGIVVWLLIKRQGREAVLVVGVLAAVTAGSEGVKLLVARPRPPGDSSTYLGAVYSYPSGHILEAVTIYGIIAVLLWRSSAPKAVRVVVPVLFVVLIALTAVARVAVNEHYPSDVLASLFGGVGVLALFAWFTDILARRDRSKSQR
jgi:undecaprenyl-diphosphatase